MVEGELGLQLLIVPWRQIRQLLQSLLGKKDVSVMHLNNHRHTTDTLNIKYDTFNAYYTINENSRLPYALTVRQPPVSSDFGHNTQTDRLSNKPYKMPHNRDVSVHLGLSVSLSSR